MESESQVKLYFGIITAMLALVIITGGFIAMVVRYQKRLLLKQQQLLKLDAEHKKELLKISVESAEANRQQIARDVHDEIGSIFSTLAISVNRFNDGSVTSNEHIESSRSLVQLGIDSVRRISHAIVPFELDLLGLEQTLEHHFETIHTLTAIQINFENKAPLEKLNKGAALAIYRIIQELSSNSLKYARATNLAIRIAPSTGFIRIQYSDDGVGASLDGISGKPGIGLKNIESRVLLLDGVVSFSTQPGRGFACDISLPLQNNTVS